MPEQGDAAPPYFIKEPDLRPFLAEMERGPLYGTVAEEEGRSRFERLEPGNIERLALRVAPPVESAKAFLFPVKERVAVYPGPAAAAGDEPVDVGLTEEAPQALAGLRACDLLSVEILDAIFIQDDFEDPFYSLRRKCTLMLTADCIEPAPSCFCNLVGGKPYPDGGFDLNFSPIEGGYLVAIGSEAGKEVVLEKGHVFQPATDTQIAERDRQREAVYRQLEEQNAAYKPARPLEEVLSSPEAAEKWVKLAEACVECGGCTFACPTCHCFTLYDQVSGSGVGPNERIKAWDSCLLSSFAKMAGVGGMKATPRPELRSRCENRLRHKYEWFPQNLGRLGCVGCGRCTEACLGGCDLREVIKELGG